MTFLSAFLFSFVVILLAVLAMAIDVLSGRRPIQGSCGGLNGERGCALCSGQCRKRAADNDREKTNA